MFPVSERDQEWPRTHRSSRSLSLRAVPTPRARGRAPHRRGARVSDVGSALVESAPGMTDAIPPRPCPRCHGREPCIRRQYLGRQCMAADKREQRRRKREAAGKASGNGGGVGSVGAGSETHAQSAPACAPVAPVVVAAKNGKGGPGNSPAILPAWILEEPARFVPYRDGTPRQPWYPAFLEHYATHGGRALAASTAGVTLKVVNRCLAEDPAFAEELDAAKSYHGDLIEWESLCVGRRKGNPLPYFDRLKAELPERHLDQLRVSSLNVNLNTSASLLGENEADSALKLFRGLALLADPAIFGEIEPGREAAPVGLIAITAQSAEPSAPGEPEAGTAAAPGGPPG